MYVMPSRIRKMLRRRQKIALRKIFVDELAKFAGQINSPLTRAEITRVIVGKFGGSLEMEITPPPALDTIDLGPLSRRLFSY